MSETKVRIISSIIGIPLLIAIILFGGVPFRIALTILCLIGVYEFYQAVNKDLKPINNIGYLFSIIFLIFLYDFTLTKFYIFISLFLLVLLITMILSHPKFDIRDVENTYIGFFYVCFLLSHIALVRELPDGKIYVWLIFITAWGSDTGAYFAGRKFGKHKLAPVLSPKKTIEGSIGGILLSALLSVVYGVIMNNFMGNDIFQVMVKFAVIGVLGSIVGQIGDLTASSIKRSTGIKDFGRIIPGHGGVMDRFDSVLFTAPMVYYLMILFSNIW